MGCLEGIGGTFFCGVGQIQVTPPQPQDIGEQDTRQGYPYHIRTREALSYMVGVPP